MQESIPIDPRNDYTSLRIKLISLASNMSIHLLNNSDSTLQSISQNNIESTCSKLNSAFGVFKLIDNIDVSVRQVYNTYRAIKGSSLKTIKFMYDNTYMFIDDCDMLHDDDVKTKLRDTDIHLLQSLDLKPFNMRMLNQVKLFGKNLVIRLHDGYLIVKKLHLDKGQPTTGHMFGKQMDIKSNGVMLD